MITRRNLLTTAAAGAAGLLTAACAGSDVVQTSPDPSTSPDTSTPPEGGGADDTADGEAPEDIDGPNATLVQKIGAGYARTAGLWDGFDPADHPTVVMFREDGRVVRALTINHDAPSEIGTARPVPVEGTTLRSAHSVTDLTEAAVERLDSVPSFEFNADLGGIDSFVMVSDAADSFLDSTGPDWLATYLHEMFHRYQFDAFKGGLGGQDVDGYDFSMENLRLAVIEDRALSAALDAAGQSQLELAARRFAGVRLHRRAADDRIGLDDRQEMYEGTARALEHLQAGADDSFAYHGGNWTRDLIVDLPTEGIKEQLAFGRFYASGAAIQRLAGLLGVEDIAARVEAGEFLADLVIDHLGVDSASVANLVTDAEVAYDGDGALLSQAMAASATAELEGPAFDESGDGDGGEPGGEFGETLELTPEQEECLNDAEIGTNGEVSDEVFEKCVGEL